LLLNLIISVLVLQSTTLPDSSRSSLDLSSPKSAAISLRAALERGDVEAVESILVAKDDAQKKLNGGYARLIVATKRLADAVATQFASSGDVMALGALGAADLKDIESAKLVEQGDLAAQLTLPGRSRPLMFHRDGEAWRIDLISFADAKTDDLVPQLAMLDELSRSFNELATDAAEGRYRTIGDLKAAVQDRVHGAIAKSLRHENPSTHPTTNSTTNPTTNQSTTSPSTRPATSGS
jgi:hypothetical protein